MGGKFWPTALTPGPREETSARRKASRLDLFRFVPFRLNRLAAEVSNALSGEYQARYGLDIPEWRVLATLGFRNDACSAQYISDCTRTHKSTISRAVTALMERQIVERVENAEDRREFRLRLTRKGRALYEELIPRLLRKEQDILSCLSASGTQAVRSTARQDREGPRTGARQPGGGREGGVLVLLLMVRSAEGASRTMRPDRWLHPSRRGIRRSSG